MISGAKAFYCVKFRQFVLWSNRTLLLWPEAMYLGIPRRFFFSSFWSQKQSWALQRNPRKTELLCIDFDTLLQLITNIASESGILQCYREDTSVGAGDVGTEQGATSSRKAMGWKKICGRNVLDFVFFSLSMFSVNFARQKLCLRNSCPFALSAFEVTDMVYFVWRFKV